MLTQVTLLINFSKLLTFHHINKLDLFQVTVISAHYMTYISSYKKVALTA